MSTSIAVLRPVALLSLMLLVELPVMRAQRAQPRQRRPEPTLDPATIRGQVVAADGGAPLRRAEVRAVSADGNSRLAATDVDGRFELRDLTPGGWTVTVSKAGFVTRHFGQQRPFDAPQPVQLTVGQRFTANLALVRGGAIAGRVFDEFGDPVAAARVQVMRSRMAYGNRRLVATGVVDQTDDLGAFRLYGLAPGDYYISATLRAAPADSPLERVASVPTYFPGTPTVGEAQRIRLGPGEEHTNITFSLLPARGAVRISGTVVNSDGAPIEDASVSLLSASDLTVIGAPFGNFGLTQSGGVFTILNVSPGAYALRAGVRSASGPPQEAFMPITVGDDDLTGITLVTVSPQIIEGRVIVDDGSALPQTSGLQVVGESTRGGGSGFAVAPNGTFRLLGVLGEWTYRLEGLPSGWMVKAIEINGKDVTDILAEFTGTERDTTARIVVTARGTELSGAVTSRGQPVAGAGIVIFPDDVTKWGYPSRYVRSTRTDQDGRFTIRALPPERSYRAVAVEYVEEGEAEDPEFLERLRDRSTSFSLGDGERKRLELALQNR